MLANKAIKEAVDAAVFIELGSEVGPLINEATASALMPVYEAIYKTIDAAVFVLVGVNETIGMAMS
jgi:hypothetical protein